MAGDARVNENTTLAAMHTVWVRVHNLYANEIIKVFKKNPGKFQSTSLGQHSFNDLVFYEACGIVIAIGQRIFYEEWLPKIVTLDQYKGYNLKVRGEVTNEFMTAAFRMGHTLVRNNFQQLSGDFTRFRIPLPVRNSFFNNRQYSEME